MRDPLNVKAIAETGPDFMGFIFYPGSPRYVGAKPDRSLFSGIPSGITGVGVFVNENYDKIIEIAKYSGLQTIQLHGSESPEFCAQLRTTGLKIIKAFNVDNELDNGVFRIYLEVCDYFLFDTKTGKPGGSGRKFDWNKLSGYTHDKPYFLSGGIAPGDSGIINALRNRGLFGVDINSRFESSPGVKDRKLVKTFIDVIKNDQT